MDHESSAFRLHSPKRSLRSRDEWFRYYAGYSDRFVVDVLGHLRLPERSTVADPWNGSGTTTKAAHDLGYNAYGFDVNPVMVLVAKARLLGQAIRPSHLSLAENMIERALGDGSLELPDEPLRAWFAPSSAAILRRLERALQRLLVDTDTIRNLAHESSLDSVSPVAAFFYTALFRTVRGFVRTFEATNPTWITAPTKAHRVRPRPDDICLSFLAHVSEMAPLPGDGRRQILSNMQAQSDIRLASSQNLPLAPASVDAFITSPPYCTRIDYAIATRPELAVLGLSTIDLPELRRRMIGTPTVAKQTITPRKEWGGACLQFLDAVASHSSRASATYYLKTHLQYFDSIYDSLRELDRALRPAGSCVIVVQDSFYKDIHNDLPQIFVQMSNSLGWVLKGLRSFPIERTMAAVNPRHQVYGRRGGAIESVLWFLRN